MKVFFKIYVGIFFFTTLSFLHPNNQVYPNNQSFLADLILRFDCYFQHFDFDQTLASDCIYYNALANAFKYALEMCKGIILFSTFLIILTLNMCEYSKFRDKSTFERAGKQFWTTGWKNISFLILKSWKSMGFFAQKGWNFFF